MALGLKQARPVTAFEFTVTTLTGIPATLAATVDNANGVLVEGTYDNTGLGYATTSGGSGTGCTVAVTIDALLVPTLSIVTAGTGYVATDTIVLVENVDFSSLGTGSLDTTVATIVGQAATTTVTVGGTGWITGDVVSASETSSDLLGSGITGTVTASALVGDTPETGGVVSAFTVVDGGTGYVTADAETVTYIGTGEVGIADPVSYYNHNQYELGGVIEEYKTGNGLVVTVAETLGVIDTLTAVDGGYNYRVGDVVAISGGVAGTGVVATVDALGTVLTLTVGGAGTGYSDGNENTVFVSRKLNQVATGVYVGSNSDNDPTVTVVRKADQQQLQVQKRTIDNGTITVFSEPTTVNAYGEVVGNTIRAEDITDEYRCVAVYLSDGVTSRFVWDTTTAQAGNRESYGFCREKTAAELAGDALVTADCPAGYVHSGGNCVTVAFGTVNTNELAGTITSKVAREQCVAGGNWYEPKAANGSRCIEAVADNFSLANFAYTTNSSAQDYAATVCQQMGYDWKPVLRTCVAAQDVTTLTTQATCTAAGHVWVAGTCYNKADFGDGYSRQGNEGNTTTKIPK